MLRIYCEPWWDFLDMVGFDAAGAFLLAEGKLFEEVIGWSNNVFYSSIPIH
jgi:hypothetical protein